MEYSWSSIPLDLVWRLISRKFLTVVVLFWLIVVDSTKLCLPVVGCVGPVDVPWFGYAAYAVVAYIFIMKEGERDIEELRKG